MPPAEAGRLRDDWMQRAALVQSYRELAGVTDPSAAIGPPPSRQAGMSEAFAASVRALELPDDALVKAMGRGEIEAQVREYARAEAVAPVDVRPQIDLSDRARQDSHDRAKLARQAENEELARSAEELTRRLDTTRERLHVADCNSSVTGQFQDKGLRRTLRSRGRRAAGCSGRPVPPIPRRWGR